MPAQQFDYQGVRVTPNVYTTLGEVDTFARAMEELAKTPPGEVDAAKMRHPRNEP
jgi:selenocysteine lyase/cysteine desulfurase